MELDKERVLKVSWESEGGDYTATKLRELFEKFGCVEGASKEAAVSFFISL